VNLIFADAVYWIAVANRKDQWHAKVMSVMRSLGMVKLVTTEEVLDEFLTHYSGHGPTLRNAAAGIVEKALSNPLVKVRPQSHQSFLDGLILYKARSDKAYSLTDCVSMLAMREEGITEVLTADDHFTQEGFIKLL
jgi:predicted nucleic acid-binding protein